VHLALTASYDRKTAAAHLSLAQTEWGRDGVRERKRSLKRMTKQQLAEAVVADTGAKKSEVEGIL
jgi:hypothetical protein